MQIDPELPYEPQAVWDRHTLRLGVKAGFLGEAASGVGPGGLPWGLRWPLLYICVCHRFSALAIFSTESCVG